ncbi:hypothetical protein [Enterobacter sichuanensis]|uniref:hypothetical protein n=1 Tax=Enterobacter sichuanensis TaxID=2071710 RepID=UPI000B4A087B|nr:MAG TPA: hypothetical protein [Caudoviricetes sp.]
MKKPLSDAQVELEAKAGYKPLAIESGIASLPFTELGDREFELLSYLLMKHEIEDGKHPDFTNVTLMQGVGERGRDCVLYDKETICGVIQCKKVTARISRPAIIKEMIKFLLFYLLDNSLMPNPDGHKYILFVADDLSEPASTLFNSHAYEIEKEVKNGKFNDYVQQVTDEYESFLKFRDNPPVDNVLALFKKLSLSFVNSTDLTSRSYNYVNLISLFFKTVSIVDFAGADRLIRQAFDDYGVKYLTDDDLKSLQSRIGGIDKEHRVSLGMADFFGYSNEFFSYIKDGAFKAVLMSIAETQRILDDLVIKFSQSKINELILSEITEKLLRKGLIHPFSVSIAGPYLTYRTHHAFFGEMISNRLGIPHFIQGTNKSDVFQAVAKEILDSSEQVMNGDYSNLAGTPEDIEFKIDIYNYIHQGFQTIADAEKQLQKDMQILQPVLDEIENIVFKLISPKRTIILKDIAFIDNTENLKKVIESIKSIEW